MKFTKLMNNKTSPPSNNFKTNGTSFRKNTNSNSNRILIFKIILMLALSNIFFYLLFSDGSTDALGIKPIQIPLEDNHARISLVLKSTIQSENKKTPISIYKDKTLIVQKAFLINEENTNSIELFNEDTQNESASFENEPISARRYTIEINKKDLPKIIASKSNSPFWVYPVTEEPKPLKRRNYEIIF